MSMISSYYVFTSNLLVSDHPEEETSTFSPVDYKHGKSITLKEVERFLGGCIF